MNAPKLFLKPLLFMVLVFGVIAIVTSITFSNRLRREMTREYESKAQALAQSMADSDIAVILNQDAGEVQARIDKYKDIVAVSYVLVADETGAIIAHTFIPDVPTFIRTLVKETAKKLSGDEQTMQSVTLKKERFLHVARPILEGLAGYVHIGMDTAIITKNIQEAVMEQQIIALILFSASLILAFFFIMNISKPLKQLSEYAGRVATKDFTNVPEITSNDEVGQLARAMRSMAWHIAELVGNLEERVRQKTKELQIARDDLKQKVEDRTSELMRTNTQLKIEIAERKVIGEALRKTEKNIGPSSKMQWKASTKVQPVADS